MSQEVIVKRSITFISLFISSLGYMGTTEFIIAARSKFVVLEAVKARVWCSALGTVVKGEVKLSSLLYPYAVTAWRDSNSYAATGVAI